MARWGDGAGGGGEAVRGGSPGDVTSGCRGWQAPWLGPGTSRRGRKVGERKEALLGLDPWATVDLPCPGPQPLPWVWEHAYILQGRRRGRWQVEEGREEGATKTQALNHSIQDLPPPTPQRGPDEGDRAPRRSMFSGQGHQGIGRRPTQNNQEPPRWGL